MKKTMSVLLCVLLLISVTTPSFAADEFRTVSTPSSYIRKSGQEVVITVSLENAPELKNGNFILSYDEAVFEFVSYEFLLPAYLNGPSGVPLPLISTYEHNTKSAVFAYPEYVSLEGDAFEFTLRVKENAPLGETYVGVTSEYIKDGTMVECTDVNTTVTIVDDDFGFVFGGTITSFNSETDNITIQLFKEGSEIAAYETTVNGNMATYTFDCVEPGSYTLRVTKKDHAVEEAVVVVDGADVTQDLTLYLYGDVDGNGSINTRDIVLLRKHIAAKDPITGVSSVTVYSGADANGDGNINTRDLVLLRKYIAGKDPITGESDVVLGPN